MLIIRRFVPSPDNTQTWIVFHATPTLHVPTAGENGWANRKGWVQPMGNKNGLPDAGTHPFAAGIYAVPSGTQQVGRTTATAPKAGLVVQQKTGGKGLLKGGVQFKKFRLAFKKLFRRGGGQRAS
jgi:hypothetical protein